MAERPEDNMAEGRRDGGSGIRQDYKSMGNEFFKKAEMPVAEYKEAKMQNRHNIGENMNYGSEAYTKEVSTRKT